VENLGETGVHHDHGKITRTSSVVALLFAAAMCGTPAAADTAVMPASATILEPAVWQGPDLSVPGAANPSVTVISSGSVAGVSSQAAANPLRLALQPAAPLPPQNAQLVAPGGAPNVGQIELPNPAPPGPTGAPVQPLLDGNSPTEDLMPPVVEGEGCANGGDQLHVRPYGGGHPTDWSWGCNGSPYRTGPGMCDNYKVCARWHVTVDGLVMSREETDQTALIAQMRASNFFMSADGTDVGGGTTFPPRTEDFGYGPGGRITFTSEVPKYVGYQMQAAWEGINDWESSVIFPKTTTTSPAGVAFQQRSLHYTTSYNSGELSWVKSWDDNWHPYCGFRYIGLRDRLNDMLNQEAQPPPVGVVREFDRKNVFDLHNDLFGFQVGMLHEAWCVTRRCTIEGFVNGGIYYNNIDYFNRMRADTTTLTSTSATVSSVVIDDHADLSEISYSGEASLSGVCRLNKCWALRAGYQVLWIDHVHLADAAFLGHPQQNDDMLFQGWHAGFECRR
jgi:hypothetical protein